MHPLCLGTLFVYLLPSEHPIQNLTSGKTKATLAVSEVVSEAATTLSQIASTWDFSSGGLGEQAHRDRKHAYFHSAFKSYYNELLQLCFPCMVSQVCAVKVESLEVQKL